MNDRLIQRAERAADAGSRLVIFIIGSALASWLLFGALEEIIAWVAS